jgi:hypothetical protein
MWAGIVEFLVGLHVLLHRLTGTNNQHFFEIDLPRLLQELSLVISTHLPRNHQGSLPDFSITF